MRARVCSGVQGGAPGCNVVNDDRTLAERNRHASRRFGSQGRLGCRAIPFISIDGPAGIQDARSQEIAATGMTLPSRQDQRGAREGMGLGCRRLRERGHSGREREKIIWRRNEERGSRKRREGEFNRNKRTIQTIAEKRDSEIIEWGNRDWLMQKWKNVTKKYCVR